MDPIPVADYPTFVPRGEATEDETPCDMRANSRPETALFGNFVVRLRIPLCGVQEYASAEIRVFPELAQKSLVFASGTAPSPPKFPDGNGLKSRNVRRGSVAPPLESVEVVAEYQNEVVAQRCA